MTIWSAAARLLLVVVACTNLWRAYHQSISIDEAFTYNQFVSHGWVELVNGGFDANNHFLNTYLAKISTGLFGLSEFTLRIPSLAGGFLYLYMVFVFSSRIFGSGPLLLINAALLALNPFIMDHLSAARGYALASAFLLCGMFFISGVAKEWKPARVRLAGLCLALSVCANLSFLTPVLAASGVLLLVAWRRIVGLMVNFALPALACGAALIFVPLKHAERDAFYFGTKSFADMVRSLIEVSLLHHRLPQFAMTRWYVDRAAVPLSDATLWLLPLIFVAALIVLLWDFRTKSEGNVWLAVTLLTLACLVMMHAVFGFLYPITRTGFYLLPLVLGSLAIVVHRAVSAAKLAAPLLAVPLVYAAAFACQWNTRFYGEWQFDADTRQIVSDIRSIAPAGQPIRIGCTWLLEPGLSFYRRMYALPWEPLDRESLEKPNDFYVALRVDYLSLAAKRPLTAIHEYKISDLILAKDEIPSR